MKFNDTLNLDEFIEIMNAQAYPLFDTSLGKDEIVSNKSFFVYSKKGAIRPSDNDRNQFLKDFTLSFVTRDSSTINVLSLAESLKKARLRFTGSEVENGKFTDSNEEAEMTTLNFVHVIKVGEW
ncbi:hypothetical protein [Companilactobacillus bobalius]|uniref:DUF806 family protein n=2 Tax=Companilactobacillus bobalius TaxID=2801451 RepID=A0A202F7S8_9LACO|nr:hypothetical protein [Companilactobacillus bobalius]GEO58476.1 hypothetical protein LBO01_16050 [Companilactobacillus paralimentarius]KAE9557575.1 hypothetical protein ATN92_15600 [Companilactobacillus bobalius]KAE9563721.1 hypothetical protein ATN92_03050 [Companilactobacillus bobalius]KRK83466.1 hypothetical protein FC78_GL001422 [Companilactobacillus bobalius DSM 19674]OVE96549.1 hypothetical protein LKACC16343_02218 [Companilactobacillus bobalius]